MSGWLRSTGGETVPPPRVLLIADGFVTGRAGMPAVEVRERLADAVTTYGQRFVMLRDHGATGEAFAAVADWLIPRLRKHAVRVVVNSNADVAAAHGVGVHVGTRGPSVGACLRQGIELIGYSAHTAEEAREAASAGASYVTFSPVYPTSSKPAHSGVGVEALASAVRAAAPVPVYALGGVTPTRAVMCRTAGAQGAAVLSGWLDLPRYRVGDVGVDLDDLGASLQYFTAIANAFGR